MGSLSIYKEKYIGWLKFLMDNYHDDLLKLIIKYFGNPKMFVTSNFHSL